MEIKVLTENTVYKKGFLGEHGLSLWMETKGKQYLFDMGQSGVFMQNARKLKLDLEQLDGIILSHGHYDHCGGMLEWAKSQKAAEKALQTEACCNGKPLGDDTENQEVAEKALQTEVCCNGKPSGDDTENQEAAEKPIQGQGFSCKARKISVYINQRAFDKKYSRHPVTGELMFNGIHEEAEKWMKESADLICTREGCTKVAEDIYLLSKIPYMTEFESVPARFLKEMPVKESLEGEAFEGESKEPEFSEEISVKERLESEDFGKAEEAPEAHRLTADTMEDEQLLVIREKQGLCVFAGCAHPGIVNCLNYVQQSFPGEHIHSLVAGMHLKGCSSGQLAQTINSFRKMDIDVIIPLHCTGILAIAAIKEAMGDKCLLAEVGKTVVL